MDAVIEVIDNIVNIVDKKKRNSFILKSLANILLTNKEKAQVIFRKLNSENSTLCCPNCKSMLIVKNGFNRLRIQRYKCNNCKKIFCDFTNTTTSYSKKNFDDWYKYIQCMGEGMTIRASAKRVGISNTTSFQWRHKILNAMETLISDDKLSNNICIEDTYFKICNKGNHKNNRKNINNVGFNNIDKEAYKNNYELDESSTIPNINNGKLSVICAIDNSLNIVSKIGNIGKPTLETIASILGGKIEKGSFLVTTNNLNYEQFARHNNLKRIHKYEFNLINELKYDHKAAIRYTLQLQKFIRDLRGVATKYLKFYLIWFKWMYKSIDIDGLFMKCCAAKNKICGYNFSNLKVVNEQVFGEQYRYLQNHTDLFKII